MIGYDEIEGARDELLAVLDSYAQGGEGDPVTRWLAEHGIDPEAALTAAFAGTRSASTASSAMAAFAMGMALGWTLASRES